MSYFCKKRKQFFAFFFLRHRVTNFNTSPKLPPFENYLLDILNSEQKPSAKKPVDQAGQPAMILKFTGQVG